MTTLCSLMAKYGSTTGGALISLKATSLLNIGLAIGVTIGSFGFDTVGVLYFLGSGVGGGVGGGGGGGGGVALQTFWCEYL